MVPIPGLHLAFIVRIRLELDSTDQDNEPVLRGMLQPIGSTTMRYFSTLDSVPRILQEFIEGVSSPGEEPWREIPDDAN